jgi:small subunit ribosomal protein S14
MAKTCLVVKHKAGRFKFKVRRYNRCGRCGRPRGYFRRFGLCRCCVRELAHQGLLPGVMKASW